MTKEPPLVEARGLDKLYSRGEIIALNKAQIRIRGGEIHGLLGENGSGKTTLIRCLAGQLGPDAGEILIDGKSLSLSSRGAAGLGIAVVPQHPRLIPSLTVLEYLRLCAPLGEEELKVRLEEIGEGLGIDLPLHTRGERLGANLVTAAVLAGALVLEPRLLILDEPTTSFSPRETANLFRYLEKLAGGGTAVLLVSHKIREVHSLVRRMTLLRRGSTVAESEPGSLSLEEVSRMLMGSGEAMPELTPAVPGRVCLKAENLSRVSSEGGLHSIDFSLRGGEILAVSGIRENGLDCLEGILSGREAPDSGTLRLAGGKAYPASPRGLREEGIVLVPSDRLESGAAQELSVADNAAVLERRSLSRRGILTAAARRSYAEGLLKEYDIESSPDSGVFSLSGGMLQRLILGRELRAAGKLVILCEPAWGLDVRSRREVYQRILALREAGAGVLLLASDIDEVLEIADRLLVLYDGRITARFSRAEFDHDKIGEAMLGISEGDAKA
jgi:general nucleoside transport system ATP-binding protein